MAFRESFAKVVWMFGYLIRSVLQAIMVMVAVAFIAFSMFRYVGDPVASIVGQDATLKDRTELADSLGLNDPFLLQFGRFVGNAAQNYGARITVQELRNYGDSAGLHPRFETN